MTTLQTQEQANAYWSDKEHKKWVVTFTAGSRRKRLSGNSFVGATTSAKARRAGIADMEERGHTWVRSAAATVRLATAQDLGCVAVASDHFENGLAMVPLLEGGGSDHIADASNMVGAGEGGAA